MQCTLHPASVVSSFKPCTLYIINTGTVFCFIKPQQTRHKHKREYELARIRTWNLLIRSQTRYPLRHKPMHSPMVCWKLNLRSRPVCDWPTFGRREIWMYHACQCRFWSLYSCFSSDMALFCNSSKTETRRIFLPLTLSRDSSVGRAEDCSWNIKIDILRSVVQIRLARTFVVFQKNLNNSLAEG